MTVFGVLAEPNRRQIRDLLHRVAWFPTTVEGDRAAGVGLHFRFREMEGEAFHGEMLGFAPTLMEMQWGDETLRFDLQPHDDGSALFLHRDLR